MDLSRSALRERTFSSSRHRRSPRLALSLPIRVYAKDAQGREFVEDSQTVVVTRHGGKIRLTHFLQPEEEVRILSVKTGQESAFRVVNRVVGGPGDKFTFWGVECSNPALDIWGIRFPASQSDDQHAVRALLRCPICRAQELIYLDEPLVESINELGGLLRTCPGCGRSAVWDLAPNYDA